MQRWRCVLRIGGISSLLGLLFIGPLAQGQGMRCGTQLVTAGDTQHDVLARCGSPTATRDLFDPNAPEHRLPPDAVPSYHPNIKWIYPGAPGEFSKVVSFEGGVVTEISQGARNP